LSADDNYTWPSLVNQAGYCSISYIIKTKGPTAKTVSPLLCWRPLVEALRTLSIHELSLVQLDGQEKVSCDE